MTLNEKNGSKIVVVESAGPVITDAQSALDLMADVRYSFGCNKIVIEKQAVCEEFFDLKTKIAGEVLQKYSNYGVKIAIVGDFSVYKSKSLRDFIYECNNGNQVFFLPTKEEAIERLHNMV